MIVYYARPPELNQLIKIKSGLLSKKDKTSYPRLVNVTYSNVLKIQPHVDTWGFAVTFIKTITDNVIFTFFRLIPWARLDLLEGPVLAPGPYI